MPHPEQGKAEPEVYVLFRPWSGPVDIRANPVPYKNVPGGLQLLHDKLLTLDPDGTPEKIDATKRTHTNNVLIAGQLAVRVRGWRDWSLVTSPGEVSEAVFSADPQDPSHHIIEGGTLTGRERALTGLTEEERTSAGSVPCVITGQLIQNIGIVYPGDNTVTWHDATMGTHPSDVSEILGPTIDSSQS